MLLLVPTFFTGRDGALRSNRMMCQLAGQYVDLFIGATLIAWAILRLLPKAV